MRRKEGDDVVGDVIAVGWRHGCEVESVPVRPIGMCGGGRMVSVRREGADCCRWAFLFVAGF